ncbi:intermediate filament protein [Ophiocordyceps camponoti-floridani]|uniref:Intermediate filament protein n=1 Tax=Ophiocordyceps camponoti-floridani TaxID=2030778 RepID=A0A8H4VHZ0_9HYPO|nr:intermediate filament protein [Ophiocordyceps camponoti-floridani]
MALKRRQAVLGVAVAITACAYAWSPGVRWALYSFVAGFVVCVVAFFAVILTTARRPLEKRTLPRVAFLDSRRWRVEVDARHKRQREHARPSTLDEALLSETVARRLDDLLGLVRRDFVCSWYSHISPNAVFPDEVDYCIRQTLFRLIETAARVDLADVITGRLMPILTAHFRDFNEAERSVRGRKLNRSVTESDELDLAIASKYRQGHLHDAASLSFSDTKMIQQDYLRGLVARVMPQLMPEGTHSSRIVSILVREIVACAVLFPVAQLLSDPDTWNQLMESYGRSMLQDRSTVRKLRAALDQHAHPTATPRAAKSAVAPRIASGDGERKFEKFIRGIRKVNNLSDARRFRSEVSSQLKRDLLEDNQDPVYLRRLEMGKRLLDQRVDQLAAVGNPSLRSSLATSTTSASSSKLENASLVELLRDSSGLSYFMEYMDRQRLMPLVQFWLVVDGFRNPLEDDAADEDNVDANGDDAASASSNLPMWKGSDRADLQQIHQAYLSKPELGVPDSTRQEVRQFLKAGSAATPAQYHRARQSILKAQSAVLAEMQSRYFQAFKKSDLYYKCLAAQEASSASAARSRAPSGLPEQVRQQQRPPPVRAAPSYLTKPKSFVRLATSQADSVSTKRSDSASDLRSLGGGEFSAASRRSLDDGPSSPGPLFGDDDVEHESLFGSVQSLDQNVSGQSVPDTKVVQAVEQALNNIMGDDRPQTAEDLRASLFGADDAESTIFSDRDNGSSRGGSIDAGRPPQATAMAGKDLEKPSISSLGLVSAASRIGVFVDDDLFDDSERHLPDETDEADDVTGAADEAEDEVHEAAPGDLGLAEAIAALSNDIDRLVAQEAVVDSLTNKAELTNNASELRILRKSKASLQREIRRKELQRQQYVVQESDNSLYGRSTVRIKSIQVGREDDGREFALYVVEVQRNAGEQMPAASWIVTRRYSEFHDLHQKLRFGYPSVRGLDFPRRRMVMKFQSEFLRKRSAALEAYLRQLLLLPDVCRSRELRSFLSQSVVAQGQDMTDREDKKDMMTRLYDSVADGMDDILGNIPVLDQISVAGQNLITAATSQLNSIPPGVSDVDAFPAAAEAEAELNAFEDKELTPFIKPICDIFLEIFGLNRGNNWLRGRAVVMVLQQLLGGTIERKVRDNVRALVQEESLLRYMDLVTDSLWPGGELRREREPRAAAAKKATRTEASLMLATLVPDLAGSVVGRANAQAASRRILATLNNARLNAHLVFSILDEVVAILFEG